MGLLDTFAEIGKKVPEIAGSLKQLSTNETFREHVGKAGTIGSLCLVGLEIYNKIKNDLQASQKQAFGSLLRIVFESTKEALPQCDNIGLKKSKLKNF